MSSSSALSQEDLLARAAAPVAEAMVAVEARLVELLPPDAGELTTTVYHYMLQAGGKRLRPQLALLSCAAAGAECMQAVGVAVAVEVLHLASLIHDDVIDEATERRGQPSARQKWGNRAAVLVGDYLVAEIFQQLAGGLDPAVLGLMARTVAVMARSELEFEQNAEPDEAQYYDNIAGKTGALLAAVCEAGALTAGDREAARHLRQFGQKLGEAFQITDDLLDLYGDDKLVGKPVRQDLRRGQWTLAVLHALHAGSPAETARLRELLVAAQTDDAAARQAAALAVQMGGEAHARGQAERLVSEALICLEALAPSPARDSLRDLAQAILQRQR